MNHNIFSNSPAEEPRVYWSRENNCWILDHEIRHRWRGREIIVPRHYPTDLASVPFFVRPIINTFGSFNMSSILHDYVYEHRGVLPNGAVFTRADADRMFFDRMVQDGTPIRTATVMWLAVRCWPCNWRIFKTWEGQ